MLDMDVDWIMFVGEEVKNKAKIFKYLSHIVDDDSCSSFSNDITLSIAIVYPFSVQR